MIADLTAHAVAQALRERTKGTFDSGLFHMTAAGQTTWHGFATAIVDAARRIDPANVRTSLVEAIGSDAFPTPARRPAWSLLNNDRFDRRFGLRRCEWKEGLDLVISDLMVAEQRA